MVSIFLLQIITVVFIAGVCYSFSCIHETGTRIARIAGASIGCATISDIP